MTIKKVARTLSQPWTVDNVSKYSPAESWYWPPINRLSPAQISKVSLVTKVFMIVIVVWTILSQPAKEVNVSE